MAEAPAASFRPPPIGRSLALRLVVLVFVFLTVPLVVYQQFRAADQEKQRLLLESAEREGQLIAGALRPQLQGNGVPADLTEQLTRLVEPDTYVKLLLRPAQVPNADGFYYVASAPPVPAARLEAERTELIERGILGRLEQSCTGNQPLALRLQVGSGQTEILTSITPITTEFGCWAVVTSHASAAYLGSSIGQPYWKTREVRAAALVYVGMAVLALAIFVGIWRNLRRFRRLARRIGVDQTSQESFAAQNTLPELHGVALEFDRLVQSLRNSADSIRRAAEDNAHAFKTPIGVIRQSIEPLKRMAGSDHRGVRSIEMIEQSLSKLDNLVSCAQHMEETMADLVQPAMARVDLSALLEHMLRGLEGQYPDRALVFRLRIQPGVRILGNAELLEAVTENLVENAVSFSPVGGVIGITLTAADGTAVITVEDDGPGVDPAKLDRIFERYFSDRPAQLAHAIGDVAVLDAVEPHFGIGLWLVRRNVEALGGRVIGENRPEGGFRMRVALPQLDGR